MKFTPMTVNILKNLVTPKATRNYPFVVREPFERARGALYNEIEKCIFCGLCSRKCPSQCITVDKKTGSWVCDPFACVYCGTCEEACPVDCLHHTQAWRHVTSEREMITMQGEPPKPKKKPAAKKKDDGKEAAS